MSNVSSLRPVIDQDVLCTVEVQVLSACMWTMDNDLLWSQSGKLGPVSSPRDNICRVMFRPAHQKLAHIQKDSTALRTRLMVRIVRLAPAAELQPNAFLNLPRLRSPSPRAVFFPGNRSYAPPKTLYKTLVLQQPCSSSALSPAGRTHTQAEAGRAHLERPTCRSYLRLSLRW
ncbi:hypothetical protein L227DRAFT_364103 [Lentinus tigrinus ALCF2SS1-6]|uniref:Uncharacterized protein n=1 Tax=Lentinus tigrinus ALCF2SS1-6 TaxID=1328759 RepID=A0A5C2SL54_9APHY|nr:hypothetical protein L227DRAFT_364103 [Lentinus tigrinus ALCF2SS1-6]